MDFSNEITFRFLRIIAIVALLMGLGDAARLLGVTAGSTSPLQVLGPTGFIYLSVFCLARLFSAVGLWIGANWGAVLLVGATLVEILLAVTGNPHVRIDIIGFGLRLLMVGGIAVLFVLALRRRRVQD